MSGSSSSRPNRFSRPSIPPSRPPIRPPQPSRSYSQRTIASSSSSSRFSHTATPFSQQPPQPQPTVASGSSSRPSAPSPSSSSTTVPPPPPPPETIGTYLSLIASSLSSSISLFQASDTSHWTPDEHAQVLALLSLRAQAAQGFQSLAQLVGGGLYFEHDDRPETVKDLRTLAGKFHALEEGFRDWVGKGGPINPLWVRETAALGTELRRAMRKGARRVWEGMRAGSEDWEGRCLGGEVVWKGVRRVREERERKVGTRWWDGDEERGRGRRRGSLETVVPECNSIGSFERLGEEDVAFVCDYCDGFSVWENLKEVPSERRVEGPTVEGYPNWAASGRRCTVREGEEEKRTVVFAPLAIANHVPPRHGEWMSRLVCPYCEEYTYIDAGDEGGGERRWTTEQKGYESMAAFQEHLEWSHTAMPKAAIPFVSDGKCAVM